MPHERDERWAYVTLVVLVAAYVVYRYVGSARTPSFGFPSLELSSLSASLPDIDFGKFGRTAPYLLWPLVAVASELYRRHRAKVAKAEWEERVRTEGFLRQQENVEIRFGEGASGKFQGDVRLTRAALYVMDRSWRRGPTRLVFAPTAGAEPVVQEVTVSAGKSPEIGIVRVRVGGPAKYSLEFPSAESEAWRAELRRLTGARLRAEKEEQPSE